MRCIQMIAVAVLTSSVSVGASQKVTSSAASKRAVSTSAAKSLLPDAFAGWEATGPAQSASDPQSLDPVNAAALREYGFQHATSAAYQREGETLKVKALTFKDVSGSYGAYSYYRGTGWPKEDIGSGAASNKNRVLFWIGATVVDATFSKVTPESGLELRELARQFPAPEGTNALAPPILSVLPKHSLDGQTTHYAEGPAGYVGAGGVLPPQLIGFDRDAEAVTANYSLSSGPAVLTLIEYPTSQMAEAQENAIRNYIKAGSAAQPAFPKPLADSDQASLEVRRTGPVVAIISGDAIPDESHRLIESVYYRSDLISVPQPTESEVSRTSKLLLGIAGIVVVGSLAAILLGFFLGGGRALYRVARGKPASSVYEAEFIRLDLHE